VEVQKQSEMNTTANISNSAAQVRDWLTKELAEELRIDRSRIRADQPILSFGIDSVNIVSLMAKLEDWGGFRFSGNPLEDHETIEALSDYVAGLIRK
jgi:acyl carrier protein